MKSDAPVPMFMVVEIGEFGDELPAGQGVEPFREHRRVLQYLVHASHEWIVVGNPWPGMGTGPTKTPLNNLRPGEPTSAPGCPAE